MSAVIRDLNAEERQRMRFEEEKASNAPKRSYRVGRWRLGHTDTCSPNNATPPLLQSAAKKPTNTLDRRISIDSDINQLAKATISQEIVKLGEEAPVIWSGHSAIPSVPRDHDFIHLVAENVSRGFMSNKALLRLFGSFIRALYCPSLLGDTTVSCQISVIRPNTQISSVPLCLQPTQLQMNSPHPAWIDALPFPEMRDNLIRSQLYFDHVLFLKDIVGDLVHIMPPAVPEQHDARLREDVRGYENSGSRFNLMASFDEDELVQLSFLRDEEADVLIAKGFLPDHTRLLSPLNQLVVFTLDGVILSIATGPYYPAHSVTFEVTNVSVSREDVDHLRRSLKALVAKADLTNNLENWQRRSDDNPYGVFEPVMVVLELVQETVRQLETYRTRRLRNNPNPVKETGWQRPDEHLLFLSPKAKQPVEISNIPFSTKELAYRLLRTSPAAIATDVGHATGLRVLHVEQVLRADLAHGLETFQSSLAHSLSRLGTQDLRRHVPHELRDCRAEDMVAHLVQPKLTWHGTHRQFIPSIVRHGFSLPGRVHADTGVAHEVRCGSTYGLGVYTSPDPMFSVSYTGSTFDRTPPDQFYGIKLVACATVMGRSRVVSRDDEWFFETKPMEGADSHVANQALEYVVFDKFQTIPVYVLHLDWGQDNAKYFNDLPEDPRQWARLSSTHRLNRRKLEQEVQTPGDKQRMKEAIFSKAAKYFPYGYGPATGNKFVVEEVGEVSEDEEDYGEYQSLRAEEGGDKKHSTEFWTWVKEAEKDQGTLQEGLHAADEYSSARQALRVAPGFTGSACQYDSLDYEREIDEIPELGILNLHDDD
ncbi:hypothetical protein HJFPF1_09459 [Paramyrothecium foliicola]|nr:hypothetical protein HJFPF1_09459 [Paramyrothecium foliicola]